MKEVEKEKKRFYLVNPSSPGKAPEDAEKQVERPLESGTEVYLRSGNGIVN